MLDCFFGPSLLEERKGIADDFLAAGEVDRFLAVREDFRNRMSAARDSLGVGLDEYEFAAIQRQVS